MEDQGHCDLFGDGDYGQDGCNSVLFKMDEMLKFKVSHQR